MSLCRDIANADWSRSLTFAKRDGDLHFNGQKTMMDKKVLDVLQSLESEKELVQDKETSSTTMTEPGPSSLTPTQGKGKGKEFIDKGDFDLFNHTKAESIMHAECTEENPCVDSSSHLYCPKSGQQRMEIEYDDFNGVADPFEDDDSQSTSSKQSEFPEYILKEGKNFKVLRDGESISPGRIFQAFLTKDSDLYYWLEPEKVEPKPKKEKKSPPPKKAKKVKEPEPKPEKVIEVLSPVAKARKEREQWKVMAGCICTDTICRHVCKDKDGKPIPVGAPTKTKPKRKSKSKDEEGSLSSDDDNASQKTEVPKKKKKSSKSKAKSASPNSGKPKTFVEKLKAAKSLEDFMALVYTENDEKIDLKVHYISPKARHDPECSLLGISSQNSGPVAGSSSSSSTSTVTCKCDVSWQKHRNDLVKILAPSSSESNDPLTKENPLEARGVQTPKEKAKLTALTTEQETVLREFFDKKKINLDKEEWENLSEEERKGIQKANQLPKWATTAVRRDSANLARILARELTPEIYSRELLAPLASTPKSSGEAWGALKKRFSGVGLFSDPLTPKERSFLQAYNSLREKYPHAKNLPRPKKNPAKKKNRKGTQNSKSEKSGSASPMGQLNVLVDLAKGLGAIVKALKGD